MFNITELYYVCILLTPTKSQIWKEIKCRSLYGRFFVAYRRTLPIDTKKRPKMLYIKGLSLQEMGHSNMYSNMYSNIVIVICHNSI